MDDTIFRADAIALANGGCHPANLAEELARLPTAHRPVDEWCVDCKEYDSVKHCCPRFNRVIRTALDDAERLTADDIKTIRIHMNAFKESLCNQGRWKDAEEYQQIVDKLDALDESNTQNTLDALKQRWIPVTERLPKEDSKVIITDEDGDIYIARYEHNPWTDDPIVEWWSDEYRVYPVAWMPLPEPYRKDGDT